MSLFGDGSIWDTEAASLFFVQSNVSKLLDEKGALCSVEELLIEDEIIQEAQAQSAALIDFITKEQHLKQLIYYLVVPQDVGNTDKAYRFPYMVCEVLSCAVPALLNQLVARELTHLDTLFSLVVPRLRPEEWRVDDGAPLPPYLLGYWCKVVAVLAKRRPCELMAYLDATPGIARGLTQHIDNSSVGALLCTLLDLPLHGTSQPLGMGSLHFSRLDQPSASGDAGSDGTVTGLLLQVMDRGLAICCEGAPPQRAHELAVPFSASAAQTAADVLVTVVAHARTASPHSKYAAEGYNARFRDRRRSSGGGAEELEGAQAYARGGLAPGAVLDAVLQITHDDAIVLTNLELDPAFHDSVPGVRPVDGVHLRMLKALRNGGDARALVELCSRAVRAMGQDDGAPGEGGDKWRAGAAGRLSMYAQSAAEAPLRVLTAVLQAVALTHRHAAVFGGGPSSDDPSGSDDAGAGHEDSLQDASASTAALSTQTHSGGGGSGHGRTLSSSSSSTGPSGSTAAAGASAAAAAGCSPALPLVLALLLPSLLPQIAGHLSAVAASAATSSGELGPQAPRSAPFPDAPASAAGASGVPPLGANSPDGAPGTGSPASGGAASLPSSGPVVPSQPGTHRLGLAGLAAARLLCEVARCGWPEVAAAAGRAGLHSALLDSMTSFAWHSILHRAVTDAVVDVLNNGADASRRNLLFDCKLLTRVVAGCRFAGMPPRLAVGERGAVGGGSPSAAPKVTRVGYTGHLVALANTLLALWATPDPGTPSSASGPGPHVGGGGATVLCGGPRPLPPQLRGLLASHSDWWAFVDGELAVYNIAHGVLMGGLAPDAKKSGAVGASADATGAPKSAVDEVAAMEQGEEGEDDAGSAGSSGSDEEEGPGGGSQGSPRGPGASSSDRRSRAASGGSGGPGLDGADAPSESEAGEEEGEDEHKYRFEADTEALRSRPGAAAAAASRARVAAYLDTGDGENTPGGGGEGEGEEDDRSSDEYGSDEEAAHAPGPGEEEGTVEGAGAGFAAFSAFSDEDAAPQHDVAGMTWESGAAASAGGGDSPPATDFDAFGAAVEGAPGWGEPAAPALAPVAAAGGDPGAADADWAFDEADTALTVGLAPVASVEGSPHTVSADGFGIGGDAFSGDPPAAGAADWGSGDWGSGSEGGKAAGVDSAAPASKPADEFAW